MLKYNNFIDQRIIKITESFVADKIDEKEYETLLTNYLVEGLNVKSITNKVIQFLDYIMKNLNKLTTKIITIAKTVLKIAKQFKPIYTIVVILMVVMMMNTAQANMNQDLNIDGDDKIEATTNKENFAIMNAAIGFIRMLDVGDVKGADNLDHAEAMASLIAIRDKFEKGGTGDISLEAQRVIDFAMVLVKYTKDQADAKDINAIEVLMKWYLKGKDAMLKTFIIDSGSTNIEINNPEGDIIKKHDRTVN